MTNKDRFNSLLSEISVFELPVGRRLACANELKKIYIEDTKITGETSDGYHTFNELYHHRAILFSVIVSMFKDKAWKSKKHADGTMFDDMFIVGIDTPDGPTTYHYDINPYWNIFDCKELEQAPEWDGHTPADAIERIGSLREITFEKPLVEHKKSWWKKWFRK